MTGGVRGKDRLDRGLVLFGDGTCFELLRVFPGCFGPNAVSLTFLERSAHRARERFDIAHGNQIAPASGIEDLARGSVLLLAAGAPIDEVNAVRKHVSLVGGGRLAQRARCRRVEVLAVSDVPGDRLDVGVEIDDRRRREIGCDVDAPTCSLTLDGCLQRQTWRVEVR